MRHHPAASLFPLLSEPELTVLAEDIREHGQIEPAIIFDGALLDGRNREAACKLAGVELRTRELKHCDSPTAYVISANAKRRHLTPAQRALVAVDALPMFEAEGRKRKAVAGKAGHAGKGKKKDSDETALSFSQDNAARSTVRAAKAVGASEHAVRALQSALADEQKRPEIRHAINAGCTVADAARLATLDVEGLARATSAIAAGAKPTEALRRVRHDVVRGKALALPVGQYRVIYADPPWRYSDTRRALEGYDRSAAEDQYPTMSVAELKVLDVGKLAGKDSVLFCWATCPLLPDALDVISAWGFVYKTLFAWDKQRVNFGHYHTASLELLIVATRGSGVPQEKKREPQLLSVARGKHSAKPEEARRMIDRMYPDGPRIELFRRGAAPKGWDAWGNEIT